MKASSLSAAPPGETERELRLELEARSAEADWLRAHYDEHLRQAFARIGALEDELAQARTATPAPVDIVLRADYERLRAEADRLGAAEQRYIDRIEELKQQLQRARQP